MLVTSAAIAAVTLLATPSAQGSGGSAAARYHRADTAVVGAAKRAARCHAAHGYGAARCAPQRAALQRAGLQLSAAQVALRSRITAASLSSRQKAPVITVTGARLSWNRIAGSGSYILVRRLAGRADEYSSVSGTSTTPGPLAGKTVTYRVRTAVVGSVWARAVQIRSTAAAGETGSGAAYTPRPPADFHMGIVTGSAITWELPFVKQLGARTARMEFDIATPAADLAPAIDAYANAGIQPLLLAGFQGRMPTVAEARNLGTWAAAYGPGGTFWNDKHYPPGTAVAAIEFGNESNQSWQYPNLADDPNWANTGFYAGLARQYALRFRDARTAIQAANPGVGLLAIGDTPGNWPTWMDNVFKAVPQFATLVSGWVMHPYGPASRWQPNIDNALAQAAAHGAPGTIPIYVTEYGIASDNGRCLDDNYGWDTCMTYDQAATALSSTVNAMRRRYRSRLRAIYLYQAHDLKDPRTAGSSGSYFGGLTLEGAAKGAYTATVRSLLATK